MPQVPVYGDVQVRPAPLQPVFQNTPDVSSGTRALAQGLSAAAEAADRIDLRDAQAKAYETQNKIQSAFLDYQQNYLKERQGDKAKGLGTDVVKWWNEAAKNAAGSLNPRAQAIINQSLKQARLQAETTAGNFELQQMEFAADKSWLAAKIATRSTAAANPFVQIPSVDEQGNPVMLSGVDVARADLRKKNAEYAQRKGLTDPEVLKSLNLEDTTKLHTDVLQGLARNAPDQARAYFAKYKDEIDGGKHAELNQTLDTVGNAAKAQMVGAELAKKYSPTETSKAQEEIDKMEGSPELKSAVRAELEHRHRVLQQDQDKAQALLVPKVMEMLYSGKSKAAIMASPVYQALRDKGAVLKAITDKEYSDILRANANDARALTQLQRRETELRITQSAAAFAYSDPVVLNNMPREKIAALLPVLGQQWTHELLTKKDAFGRDAAKLRNAVMDNEDFKLVAKEMGLKPNAAKSEAQKDALMQMKAQTEQMIDAWQAKNGREMPRDEKRLLMRKALATEITVKGFIWDDKTNILQVSQDQLKNVVVPDVDRGQIIQSFRTQKNDPTYMPPAIEIGRAYILKKQRDAATTNAR